MLPASAAVRAAEGTDAAEPPARPDRPHLVHPEARYKAMLAMSDEAYTARASMPEPPVKAAD